MIDRSEWVWMPHPGHFICAFDCRFHLNTRVGDYVVSTVGELFPDANVREIYAQSRGVVLEGKGDDGQRDYMKKIGFEQIGCDRKYETMVFKAEPAPEPNSCCPWRQVSGEDVDGDGYNDSGDAYRGHIAMCEKWAQKQ